MTQQPRDRNELLAEVRVLAAAYVDGALDDAQTHRLQALIAQDDEARDIYIAYLQETFDLVQAARAVAASEEARSTPKKIASFFAQLRALPLTSRRRLISTAAAAIVVGVFLAAMAYISVPLYRAMMGNPDNRMASREIVGQLTTSRNAVWAERQVGTHDGAFLPMGHRMELRRGQAVVTHRSGAVVTLDGPLHLHRAGRRRGHA